jgi:hypothetical protein
MRRNKMSQVVDRKFKFTAISNKSGKKYTQANAVLFLVKDSLLPNLLDEYYELCRNAGVDNRQLKGVQLLKDRVLTWQRMNIKKVSIPGVEEGKEEKRVCKDNNV